MPPPYGSVLLSFLLLGFVAVVCYVLVSDSCCFFFLVLVVVSDCQSFHNFHFRRSQDAAVLPVFCLPLVSSRQCVQRKELWSRM